MIKIAVCDDEPYMRAGIASRILGFLEERQLPCQISCFADGRELLDSDMAFDILFLDIRMEGLNGMETARRMRAQGFEGLLVFLTVLKESVFEAFEVRAFDYLVKPLEEGRFRRTMERAVGAIQPDAGKCLVVQRGNACQIIPFSQIIYCEVLGRKVYLHQKGGGIVDYYDRMEDLEKRLDSRFFRCHRSYLVNLDYVHGCSQGLAALWGGSQVPISRLRCNGLKQALLLHMKERRCQDGLV